MANNVANVTTGKPKVGGAVSLAPLGTTLPANATAALAGAFVAAGYVSDAGVVNSNSPSVENIKAWGGDIVLTPLSEKADTFKMTLIEAQNINVLKAVYGSANVTGALATGITVTANAAEPEAHSWVIDMVLSGGNLKRIVIPNGAITEVGDISYTDSEAVGYEVTVTALPDASGNTHYEYIIEAGATPAAPTNQVISGYYDDGKFYYDAGHTDEITNPGTTNVYVDLTTNALYLWDGDSYEAQ